MKDVYCIADHLITSLGFSTQENIAQIEQGRSGLRLIQDPSYSPTPFFGGLIDYQCFKPIFAQLDKSESYTKLEQVFIFSIQNAIQGTQIDLSQERSLLILATTKGNIDLLEPHLANKFPRKRLRLGVMASHIGRFLGCLHQPLVLSNACISGLLAQIIAARLIRAGRFDHIVIAGGDISSSFTLSGFQSLKALSAEPCRPYDKDRKGINLGEGGGTLVFSKDKKAGKRPATVKILAGASSNDANHISGPSRDGKGLCIAIENALNASKKTPEAIDYLCAHGTATLFNDEMEAKAFAHTQLLHAPVHSLKGYLGHTLGAAGTIESIIALHALKNNRLYKSLGFEELGISQPLRLIEKHQEASLKTCLKTASGFGGCNAAIVYEKI